MQLISRIWLKILKEWWQLAVPMRLRVQGVELGAGELVFGALFFRADREWRLKY